MSSRQDLRSAFEDLTARLLAADLSDHLHVAALQRDIKDIQAVGAFAGTPAELLGMILSGLEMLQKSELEALAVAPMIAASLDALKNSDEDLLRKARDELAGVLTATRSPVRAAHKDVRPSRTNDVSATISSQPEARCQPEHVRSATLPQDSDPDILKEFVAESLDRIQTAEAALLALESQPGAPDHIHTILRAFHSIKGASGFLALEEIRGLSHSAESLLIRVRDGQAQLVGPKADLALQSCDMLRTMIQGIEKVTPGGTIPVPPALEALLVQLGECAKDSTSKPRASSMPVESATAAPAQLGASASAVPTCPAVSAQALEPAASTKSDEPADGATASSIRVNTERLDELVNMVGELVIAHSLIAQDPAVAKKGSQSLDANIGHAGKIIRNVQELAMGLRMVPLKGTFQKMTRLVRDLTRQSERNVRFVTTGEETEIDRNMVEVLNDPLVHLIRNAVDHGIEPPVERARLGKNSVGTLHLRAFHDAGNVVIELSDDGRGLDSQKILQKAVEHKLVDPGRNLPEAELLALIFRPGFSTAEKVTEISGRGIGLDVVKHNIESLRGKVEVSSTPGTGATFTLQVPLTMAIMDAMLLRVGVERYLLPTISIQHSFRPGRSALSTVAGRGEMVILRNELLPIFRLHRLFGVEGAANDPASALLIVVEWQGKRCALMVDEIIGQQQTVVKSLGNAIPHTRGVSGGAILGDGRVGLILDASDLIAMTQGSLSAVA